MQATLQGREFSIFVSLRFCKMCVKLKIPQRDVERERCRLRLKGLQMEAVKYLVILVSMTHISHCEKGEVSEDAVVDTVRNLVKNSSELKSWVIKKELICFIITSPAPTMMTCRTYSFAKFLFRTEKSVTLHLVGLKNEITCGSQAHTLVWRPIFRIIRNVKNVEGWGCVIPRCNLHRGITQPILQLFGTYLYNGICKNFGIAFFWFCDAMWNLK